MSVRGSGRPSDLRLLGLRARMLGGEIVGSRSVRLLRSASGERLHVGTAVPRHLARALRAAHACAPMPNALEAVPPALEACARLLVDAGWSIEREADIVYSIDPRVAFSSGAPVERSDRPPPSWLRHANPGGWHPIEWEELLDGRLGPWAMILIDRRVASICHTPVVATPRAAECGVWTDPAFRGRGHAAAATAQWADVLRPSRRRLFYGTHPDNASSRRVAGRLNARLLGCAWGVSESSQRPRCTIHPLSSAIPRMRSSEAPPPPTSAERIEP